MYRHYVYELRDSKNPNSESVFYVGKGVENRVSNHCAVVKRKLENNEPITEDKEIEIAALIHDCENDKGDLQELIIGRYETAEQAFSVEATLIKWVYGRELANLVQGQHHYHIREKNDYSFDDDLDREGETYSSAHKRRAKELGLKEAYDELVLRLTKYGILNLGPFEITMGGQDFGGFWPVPETNFQIQIKLGKNAQETISLFARHSEAQYYDEFIETMAVAGYLVSNRLTKDKPNKTRPKEGAFASLMQLNRNPRTLVEEEMKILQEEHDYQGGWLGSYVKSVPRNKEEEIVRWLQDFQIRVKIAKIIMNNNLNEQTKAKLIDVIKVFNQRPQAKRFIKGYPMAFQP